MIFNEFFNSIMIEVVIKRVVGTKQLIVKV